MNAKFLLCKDPYGGYHYFLYNEAGNLLMSSVFSRPKDEAITTVKSIKRNALIDDRFMRLDYPGSNSWAFKLYDHKGSRLMKSESYKSPNEREKVIEEIKGLVTNAELTFED